MIRRTGALRALALLAALSLSACSDSGKEPRLLNVRSTTEGPDEFLIVPTKPLQEPASFDELPEPTPGGTNITDPTPREDAVAALGGNPSALAGGSVEGGIVTYASRFGTDPSIRTELAAEDLQFRRDNDGKLLEKLFDVNVYFRAYAKMALDQYAELARFRRAGVRTPAAPPPVE